MATSASPRSGTALPDTPAPTAAALRPSRLAIRARAAPAQAAQEASGVSARGSRAGPRETSARERAVAGTKRGSRWSTPRCTGRVQVRSGRRAKDGGAAAAGNARKPLGSPPLDRSRRSRWISSNSSCTLTFSSTPKAARLLDHARRRSPSGEQVDRNRPWSRSSKSRSGARSSRKPLVVNERIGAAAPPPPPRPGRAARVQRELATHQHEIGRSQHRLGEAKVAPQVFQVRLPHRQMRRASSRPRSAGCVVDDVRLERPGRDPSTSDRIAVLYSPWSHSNSKATYRFE